ncbi:MAG: hypothetical protein EPO68_14700 [Planctomycetota bacterium]|nr:MAG: hypothetical protein EPO68_14700 [Planctomycetota bacterium]
MGDATQDRRQFLYFVGSAGFFAVGAAACSANGGTRGASDGGGTAVGSSGVAPRIGAVQVRPAAWPHGSREQALASAWKRARELDKPLLVALVPTTHGARERGLAVVLGGLLNHGSREELATLALSELACATGAEVERVTGACWSGDALCVLVDPQAPHAARAIDPELDAQLDFFELTTDAGAQNRTWEQMGAALEANAARRSTQLAAAIEHALVPDARALQQLAARARAVVPAQSSAAFEYLATCPEGLKADDALASAALVLAAAGEPNSARDFLLDKLVEGVRARWVHARVPGALWARSMGCGEQVEPVEGAAVQLGVACGMGHVAEHSQRFLCFYELDASGALK